MRFNILMGFMWALWSINGVAGAPELTQADREWLAIEQLPIATGEEVVALAGRVLGFVDKYQEQDEGRIRASGAFLWMNAKVEHSGAARERYQNWLQVTLENGTLRPPVMLKLLIADAYLENAARSEHTDIGRLRTKIDRLRKFDPDAHALGSLEVAYGQMLHATDPEAATRHLAHIEATAPEGHLLRTAAKKALVVNRLRTEPVQLAFTALDGRRVDFEALRGKVVLLDFWATWCVACVAQLPEIKSLYERYRGQGLEVVAVSVDHEQHVLEQFIQKQGLAWPVYFEARMMGNQITDRFGITGYPTLWLFGRDGRLVVDNSVTEIERLKRAIVRELAR